MENTVAITGRLMLKEEMFIYLSGQWSIVIGRLVSG
jgi:hypothetical protein